MTLQTFWPGSNLKSISPVLGPNCLILIVFLKVFLKTTKMYEKHPACNENRSRIFGKGVWDYKGVGFALLINLILKKNIPCK